MTGKELRKKYIEFFESKGCLHLPSDSLVPDDPSLLFTSAGMVQFKPYFIGAETPPRARVVTAQKCLRTDDIDEVGDAVHHTFFEMMGNFSFGDYFKREAILWAWEFLTDWLHLPQDRIWTSVYLDDDEAAQVWLHEVGLPPERVVRLGEDKNYWPANAPSKGPNGPCGPCNEIFLDMRPELGPPDDPSDAIAHDSNRFVEMWNLVFMQFLRGEGGELTPLPTKNIDTGLGLERVTAILQEAPSDYETDLFWPLIQKMEKLAGVKYGSNEATTTALRTIADHVRGAVFCIGDGVMPSNVKRGYVLRRMIRRAAIKARQIGYEGLFLHGLAPTVAEMFEDAYPDVANRLSFITNVLRSEEEKFQKTLSGGIHRLEEEIRTAQASESETIGGAVVFTLYDTYGFPSELTDELSRAEGLRADLDGFERLMEEQRARARQSGGMFADVFSGGETSIANLQKAVNKTEFLGYDTIDAQAKVLAILHNGEMVEAAQEGEQIQIVLDRTPFYAESGGQIGDFGHISSESGVVNVVDTRKAADIWLHDAVVASGEIRLDQNVEASVQGERRIAIMRNHTATHLLHAALRKHLGEHVTQAGSLVAPDRLRFDFTHFQAVTPQELRAIENEVNRHILADIPVTKKVMPLDEARSRGAMALFGEKYGAEVRTVTIGDVSMELCGGTHLERTAEVGLFKILSEASVAAGVRRIEAVTGQGSLEYVHTLEDRLREIASRLQAPQAEAVQAIDRLQITLRDMQQKLSAIQGKSSQEEATQLASSAVQVDGFKAICAQTQITDANAMSALADQLAARLKSAIVVLGSASDGKVMLVSKVTQDLVDRGFHAGNIVKVAAQEAGGGGGGRPDFAKAGGKNPAKLASALEKALEMIRKKVD